MSRTISNIEEALKEKGLEPVLENMIKKGILKFDSGGWYRLLYTPSSPGEREKKIIDFFLSSSKRWILLGNTQVGKTIKMINRITCYPEQIIPIIIGSNSQSLGKQTKHDLDAKVYKSFLLSGEEERDQFRDINDAIHLYTLDKNSRVPVIIALSNKHQVEKVFRIIKECEGKIRYSILFDEGDETYPQFLKFGSELEPNFRIDKIENSKYCYEMVGITATPEKLKQLWPDAKVATNALDESKESEDYVAMHTEGCDVKIVEQKKKESSNEYIKRVISNNSEYFSDPIRKVLMRADVKIDKQRELANGLRSIFNTILVNKNGIEVNGRIVKVKATKEHNEALFDQYELLPNNKPLAVIGNRKMLRGVRFHYIDRKDPKKTLLFTDMILPNMNDPDNATQTAGRLNGKIAKSSNYIGSITYWTTTKMKETVISNNKKNNYISKYASEKEESVPFTEACKYAEEKLSSDKEESASIEKLNTKQIDAIEKKLEEWSKTPNIGGARFLIQAEDLDDRYHIDHEAFDGIKIERMDLLNNFFKGDREKGKKDGGYGIKLMTRVEGYYIFLNQVKPLIKKFQSQVRKFPIVRKADEDSKEERQADVVYEDDFPDEDDFPVIYVSPTSAAQPSISTEEEDFPEVHEEKGCAYILTKGSTKGQMCGKKIAKAFQEVKLCSIHGKKVNTIKS